MRILKLFFAGIFFLNMQGYAQPIDNLELIPINPKSSDAINVVCHATLSTRACWLEKSNMTIQDSVIEISAYYFKGGYQALCSRVDTLSLGKLPGGNYTLKYNLYDSSSTSEEYTLQDTDTIHFSVEQDGRIINDLQIAPAHPKSSEATSVICHTTLSSSSCWLEKSNITIQDSIIEISAYYYKGGWLAMCDRIDTLSLGKLPGGNYILKYNLYDSSSTSEAYTLQDADKIYFSVEQDGQTIDNLKLIPPHPQSSGPTSVVCQASFSSGACNLAKSNMTLQDTLIEISAYYSRGGFTEICHSEDTLSLDQLPAGNYTLAYNLYDSSATSEEYKLQDRDTIHFSVEQGNFIRQNAVILAVLIVDFDSHQFEGGHIAYYSCMDCSIDSLPFLIDHKLVGGARDGRTTFKLDPTLDTIFDATIARMGYGEIKYPKNYKMKPPFHYTNTVVKRPSDIKYWGWNVDRIEDENSNDDFINYLLNKADSAWGAIDSLEITNIFHKYGFKAGMYFYPPWVGIVDETVAKWAIFLYNNQYPWSTQARDTIWVTDTITYNDTVTYTDTVQYTDTIRYVDTITRYDTLKVTLVDTVSLSTNNIDLAADLTAKIYPVPARHGLTIELSQSVNELSYRLINSEGVVLKTGDMNNNAEKLGVDLTGIPPGTYFIQLLYDNHKKTFKVMIE